jgi:anti-anti-sigma factor
MSNCIDALVPPTRLVAETRSEFRKIALDYVALAVARGESRITVDLSGTKEIDASGLGILLFVNSRAADQGMTTHLVSVPKDVMALLDLTKLTQIFAEVSTS